MTAALLLAIVLGLCLRDYFFYSNVEHSQPDLWLTFLRGAGTAPDQYRMGVKLAAWWLVEHLGWRFRYGFTLMDAVGGLAAAFLLYDLMMRSRIFQRSRAELRWFGSAAFVALMGFYLLWAGTFERPETLPAVGLTAALLWLWTPGGTSPATGSRQALIALALFLATSVLATVRADVAVALNGGMFVVSLTRVAGVLSLPKSIAILTSAACSLVAASVQLYMMFIVYPHTTYGGVHVLMARYDLKHLSIWPPFLLFMLPVIWTAAQFWRQRSSWERTDGGLIVGSMFYLVLWTLLGKLDEVRIFLPLALALTPLTVTLAIRYVFYGIDDRQGPASPSVERLRA